MRIKFSLRTLLIVFTVATVFFGWRLNQRASLQNSVQKIRDAGGMALYECQSPTVIRMPHAVPQAYYQVTVPYTERLEDGTEITRTRTENAGRNPGYTVIVERLNPTTFASPKFSLVSFLDGTHEDIAPVAISLPANDVDDDFIARLKRFHGLTDVLLLVEPRYYSVKSSNRSTPAIRENELKQLGKGLRTATKLLEDHLPSVKLHRNGIHVESGRE